MSATASAEPVSSVAGRATRIRSRGRPVAWMRENLFGSWWSTAITLALIYVLARVAWGFFDWGVLSAVWSVPQKGNAPDPTACRKLQGAGACWAVLADKARFILFGRYPYDLQWRPAIAVLLFIALYVVSAWRRFWKPVLAWIWLGALTAIALLMWGGLLGLTYVPQDQWGGLPITLILSTFGLAIAFPLAVLVALGRRATGLPAVRLLCVVYVELIRGVPLISLLFMASVLFPLFMPVGLNPDKLLRAQVAVILFAGAYLAEVVRGGLQALPRGQTEAADALGLTYWQRTRQIVLPQALRLVIPPVVNTFLGFFLDTSLVLIIGIYDLTTAGKVAMSDPTWAGFSTEIYLMLAVIYLAFCFSMSRYSRALELRLNRSQTR